MPATMNADEVIETFGCGTEENQIDALRSGQVINLPSESEVWITGDLHDHRRNLDKLMSVIDLPSNPNRHLILHEVIHGDYYDSNGAEGSWETLYRVAQLKCDFPNQVHFLFANHDLAQIHGEGILKAGQSVCEAFNAGVKRDFGNSTMIAQAAMTEFLLSFPLAVRTPGGIFISHSIPTDEQIPTFDFGVFDRALTPNDYRRRFGPVYQMIWGRKTTPNGVAQFADKVGARILITGHQPQETGYLANGDRHLIIASDHNQGVYLPLQTDIQYDMDDLVGRLQKFVAIAA
jgi:hypothetical protein